MGAAAAQELAEAANINHLLVADHDRLVGVLCVCDLWWAAPDRRTADLMTADPVVVGPRASIDEASELMMARNVGCLPVVRGRRAYGVITRGDLGRAGVWPWPRLVRRCLACGSRHHVRVVSCSSQPSLCVHCVGSRAPEDIARLIRAVGM
jgi:acetoin utilization protein AcuB